MMNDKELDKFFNPYQKVMDNFAKKVVDMRLSVPAVFLLESFKPFTFIGNQLMVFFDPAVKSIFEGQKYDTVKNLLEKRETPEVMIQKIEAQENEYMKIDKERKLEKKLNSKTSERRLKRWLKFLKK
jgi:hypothetical protein